MRKIQLLWGTIWRGTLWGLVVGAILGAVYGMLYALLLFIFIHNLGDAPLGIYLACYIGAFLGAIIGLVLGLAGGFLAGILAQALLSSDTYASHYRTIGNVASAIYGVLGYIIAIGAIRFFLLSPPDNRHDLSEILFVFLVPACFAGWGAAFAGRRVARWYQQESIKGVIQNA